MLAPMFIYPTPSARRYQQAGTAAPTRSFGNAACLLLRLDAYFE